MKFKTSTKQIKSSYQDCISAGYCDLQYLLNFEKPKAYTCGVYGWNYDVYEIEGVAICIGYRGMPGRRAVGIREYEKKAMDVLYNPAISDKRAAVTQLLYEFIELQKGGIA